MPTTNPRLNVTFQPETAALLAQMAKREGKSVASLKGCWRLWVGDYRIVYQRHSIQHRVDIIAIDHRKDIYEDF